MRSRLNHWEDPYTSNKLSAYTGGLAVFPENLKEGDHYIVFSDGSMYLTKCIGKHPTYPDAYSLSVLDMDPLGNRTIVSFLYHEKKLNNIAVYEAKKK